MNDPERPRLLIAEPDISRRLALIAALREAFRVEPAVGDRELLRLARTTRPDLVLIAAAPGQRAEALRLCRGIRTEPSPPRVGLIDPDGGALDPREVLVQSQANGLLTGRASPTQVAAWAKRLAAGEAAVERIEAARPGRLRRLLGR